MPRKLVATWIMRTMVEFPATPGDAYYKKDWNDSNQRFPEPGEGRRAPRRVLHHPPMS